MKCNLCSRCSRFEHSPNTCRFSRLNRFYVGHPETSLRQAAGAVLLRIAIPTPMSTPSGLAAVLHRPPALKERDGPDHSQQADPCPNHHMSARIVLWALIHAALQVQQPLDHEVGHTPYPEKATADENNKGGGNHGVDEGDDGYDGGSVRTPSWEFSEGALLVCDGILKRVVEGLMAELLPGELSDGIGGGGSDNKTETPVTTTTPSSPAIVAAVTAIDHPAAAAAVDDAFATTIHGSNGDNNNDEDECKGGWPAGLVHATPPLIELLGPLLSQAKGALYAAELMRLRMNRGCHHLEPHRQPASVGESTVSQDTKRSLLEMRQQSSDGSLELWRTGSQLLPAISRVLVWWNAKAILG